MKKAKWSWYWKSGFYCWPPFWQRKTTLSPRNVGPLLSLCPFHSILSNYLHVPFSLVLPTYMYLSLSSYLPTCTFLSVSVHIFLSVPISVYLSRSLSIPPFKHVLILLYQMVYPFCSILPAYSFTAFSLILLTCSFLSMSAYIPLIHFLHDSLYFLPHPS